MNQSRYFIYCLFLFLVHFYFSSFYCSTFPQEISDTPRLTFSSPSTPLGGMIFRWETFKNHIPHFMCFDSKLKPHELEKKVADTIYQLNKGFSEANERSHHHQEDQLMTFNTKSIKRGIFGIYFWSS